MSPLKRWLEDLWQRSRQSGTSNTTATSSNVLSSVRETALVSKPNAAAAALASGKLPLFAGGCGLGEACLALAGSLRRISTVQCDWTTSPGADGIGVPKLSCCGSFRGQTRNTTDFENRLRRMELKSYIIRMNISTMASRGMAQRSRYCAGARISTASHGPSSCGTVTTEEDT
jgi:hypothetical protein